MKKIFIILFISFISFFSISNVFAEDTGTYQYVGIIENCSIDWTYGKMFAHYSDNEDIFIYKIMGDVPISITFQTLSSARITYKTTDVLYNSCDTTAVPLTAQLGSSRILSSTIDTDYTYQIAQNDYYSSGPFYAYFTNGSHTNILSWGDGTTAEPEVPEPQDLIFVPESDTYNKCYVVQSEGVIRGYDTIPVNNASYNYRDYYIRSSYISRDGTGSWSQYSTLPICLDSSLITNDFYYRIDFPQILLLFLIINIFAIYIPIKVFSKLFRKGGL